MSVVISIVSGHDLSIDIHCGIKMLTAACPYELYFVRCTNDWLCFLFLVVLYVYVPCAVKMFNLLTATCHYVSYFVSWANDWIGFYIFQYLVLVPSNDSSLLICVICQGTNDWLCFHYPFYCMYVPCAVKMFHLYRSYVSYFVK